MNEITYKILLGMLVIAMNLIRGYYQSRYKKSHEITVTEKFRTREKGLVILTTICMAVPGLIWLFTSGLSFAQFYLPDYIRVGGFVIGVYSMWLFYRVHKTLGDNWSPVLEIRKEHTLIISGPYKYVRHPMYTAMLLWAVSFTLITANWFYSIALFACITLLFIIRIPDEEKLMTAQFGQQYKVYMLQVKRIIPFIY
ncbi:MAG: protein-S-isoprenylcysteine O-methyltransferase [Niabella sp.]